MSETLWHDLGQEDYKVRYYDDCVNIEGNDLNSDDMEDVVLLYPNEALALLQWLEGERLNLERLVLQKKVGVML